MIRLILAAIGILLICVAGEVGIQVGIYFLLPGIITVVWKIAKWIIDRTRIDKEHIDRLNREKAEQEAKEQEKRDILKKQAELEQEYTNSPSTIKMLREICGGYPPVRLPTSITIDDYSIQAESGGTVRTCNFSQYRMENFRYVVKGAFDREDLQYVVKPQIALAKAINSLLSGKYYISDYAKREVEHKTDCEGERYTVYWYQSDHVVLTLNHTSPNRTF